MADGMFKYEDCLLKHHVRRTVWLPACLQRKAAIQAAKGKHRRPLRYFTFCAVGAIDVFMLELENVLSRSDGRFDSVFFFDRGPELVAATQTHLPGAIGFPGNFVDIVLLDDPEENTNNDALAAPAEDQDVERTRLDQIRIQTRRKFHSSFPFDVINLDLEQFLFRPADEFPGKLLNAMRKLFQWQKRALVVNRKTVGSLDAFNLMFTTQIGPPNLPDSYRSMLRNELIENLQMNANLGPLLTALAGHQDIVGLEQTDFDLFFQLGVPKVIAKALDEEDWYVNGENGIRVFDFVRAANPRPYTMLHMVFQIRRKEPPLQRRAPRRDSEIAHAGYKSAVEYLFQNGSEHIDEISIDTESLQKDLNTIKEYRKNASGA